MDSKFKAKKEPNNGGVRVPFPKSEEKEFYRLNGELEDAGFENLHHYLRPKIRELMEWARGELRPGKSA